MSWLKIHNVIQTVFSRKTSLIEQAKKNVLGLVVLGVAIGMAAPAISVLSSDTANAYPMTQAECSAQSGTWGYIGSEQGCTLPQSTCAAQGGTWGYNGSTLGCTPPSSATPSSATSGGCSGNGVTLGLTSPFSSTSTMCLGDEVSSGRRFYQFIVKLSSAVPVTVTSSSNDMFDSKPIGFVKQSSILYVSKPNSQTTGYGAYTIGGTCNESDPYNKVAIHVAGPSNSQDFSVNLCSTQYSNQSKASTQVLVYLDATSIKDSSGNSTSTKGTIKGNLGITRTDPLTPDKWKKGPLSSVGIMSISLSGKETKSGNGTADWFTLANGILDIPNLESGVYTLKIVYNDKIALQALGGDPSWTTSNTLLEFPNILVPPGGEVWLRNSSPSVLAYQDVNSDGTDLTQVADQATTVPTSTCSVEGVGWIVCPIINFMADVNNVAYGLIDGMLNTNTRAVATTDPTTGKDTMTYTVWQTMRSFANVGFVIFFLIIIFSQITNLGISNYGLKKLFPRLIVAAILVNVSFFICQIGVDLSNVLGGSLKGLFESIPGYDKAGGVLANGNMIGEILVGTATVTAAVGGAIAISAGAGAGILLPVLFAALISVILTLAILAARQVMVILLTIVSPLALLAMLLPNTKNLYKQWQKIFISMLTVYPMIAVLFGASSLASSIIISTAGNDASAFVPFLLGIMVTFVPLALTPKLLQGSLKAVPVLGDMASKLAGKSNASFGNAAKPIIANQKAKSAAGKDMFGRDRKPAKFLKSIRNRRAVEYEKHAEDGIGADGKEYKKGDNVLDAKGNKIVAKNNGKPIYTGESERRRSWTQVSGDATRNIEAMTKGNQAKTETDWANRGLAGVTRAGRNTRDLLDGAQVGAMNKQAVDEQYKARLEVSKLTDPGARDIYDRLSDAQRTTAGLTEEQKKRQLTRLQNDFSNTTASNIGLDRLSTLSNMSAEEQTELGITHGQAERLSELSETNNPEGGGLKVLHHSEDAAKQEIAEIESGFKAELSERKTEGGDLHISAVNEAKNTKLAKGADDELGATVAEYTTTKSEQELIDTKFPKIDASDKEKFPLGEEDPAYELANGEREAKIAQFKALTADGTVRSGLQDAAETIKAAGERTRYAEGTSTIDLDQKILDDEAYARRVSGIAPTTARARSKAYDRVVEDTRGDVKVTESELEQSELSAQETLSLSGINAKGGKMFDSEGKFIPNEDNEKAWDSYVSARAKIKKPAEPKEIAQTALDMVQQEALVRRTIKAQDEGDNMRLTNYLEQVRKESDKAEQDAIAAETIASKSPGDEAAATAAIEARVSAKKARERSLTLSRAAAEQYSSNSKGLSPFLSTARREKLSHGDLDVTTDESVVETLGAGKMSARFVSGWNINHFVQAADTLTRGTEADVAERIKTSMDKFATEQARSKNPGKAIDDPDYITSYNESIQEQKDSIANSRKALDEAQDGPFDLDERSIKRIEKMRTALLELEKANVISKPTPLPGMTEYIRVERDPSGEIRRDDTGKPIPLVTLASPPAPTP